VRAQSAIRLPCIVNDYGHSQPEQLRAVRTSPEKSNPKAEGKVWLEAFLNQTRLSLKPGWQMRVLPFLRLATLES